MRTIAVEPAGSPDGVEDPYRAYRKVGSALALLVLSLIALELVRNAIDPSDRDFIGPWGAARLALAGTPGLIYDSSALHALQAQFVTFRGPVELAFPYPPPALFLPLPFAALPFPLAMALWALVTLAVWLAVVRRMFPRSGWLALAFPPVFANAAIGQNGCVTASLLAGGLLLLPRRPFVAGLVLGCLIIKPQLALLLPVAMLAGRHWRAIAGAAASVTAALLLGLLAFGARTYQAWIEHLPAYAAISANGLTGWPKLVSVYAAARQAGLGSEPAFILHGAIATLAACAVWQVWRSHADWRAKAAVLAAATMLASPHLFFYDAVILTVPLLFLAERRAAVALVALLWLAPIMSIALLPGPVNVGPLVPIALLWLLWRSFRGERAAGRGTAPPPERSSVDEPDPWLTTAPRAKLKTASR